MEGAPPLHPHPRAFFMDNEGKRVAAAFDYHWTFEEFRNNIAHLSDKWKLHQDSLQFFIGGDFCIPSVDTIQNNDVIFVSIDGAPPNADIICPLPEPEPTAGAKIKRPAKRPRKPDADEKADADDKPKAKRRPRSKSTAERIILHKSNYGIPAEELGDRLPYQVKTKDGQKAVSWNTWKDGSVLVQLLEQDPDFPHRFPKVREAVKYARDTLREQKAQLAAEAAAEAEVAAIEGEGTGGDQPAGVDREGKVQDTADAEALASTDNLPTAKRHKSFSSSAGPKVV